MIERATIDNSLFFQTESRNARKRDGYDRPWKVRKIIRAPYPRSTQRKTRLDARSTRTSSGRLSLCGDFSGRSPRWASGTLHWFRQSERHGIVPISSPELDVGFKFFVRRLSISRLWPNRAAFEMHADIKQCIVCWYVLCMSLSSDKSSLLRVIAPVHVLVRLQADVVAQCRYLSLTNPTFRALSV